MSNSKLLADFSWGVSVCKAIHSKCNSPFCLNWFSETCTLFLDEGQQVFDQLLEDGVGHSVCSTPQPVSCFWILLQPDLFVENFLGGLLTREDPVALACPPVCLFEDLKARHGGCHHNKDHKDGFPRIRGVRVKEIKNLVHDWVRVHLFCSAAWK
jgi:hypothetical protein